MYLKIEANCRVYILRVTDIRNVSTGFSGKGWEIYVYYRCGADAATTICFDDKNKRNEAFEKIYQALVSWEERKNEYV